MNDPSPCFLKLAHWPKNPNPAVVDQLTPGMYLPLPYVRLLLSDDCALGSRANSNARYLGYDRVDRRIVGSQFVELVKNGLIGTVGTSVSQLADLVRHRAKDGFGVMVAADKSVESAKERRSRARKRGRPPIRKPLQPAQDLLFE